MSFSRRLLYFLVHRLGYTNKEAKQLLENGRVQLNGIGVTTNCPIDDRSEIAVDGQVKRAQKKEVYLKFNKPPGYESTLNSKLPDNLSVFFPGFDNLFIAGRLDKQSEGLLLISNDGKWVENICNPKFEKEKEYQVILDRTPDRSFVECFSQGVWIGNYLTKPCFCKLEEGQKITVVLTEGKNRQIRRMCKALKYDVLSLKRVRVAHFQLDNLLPGQVQHIDPGTLQLFND